MSLQCSCNQFHHGIMTRILILVVIFLLINFARSQVYRSSLNSYGGGQYASAYSDDMGKQYSQTKFYQQPAVRRTKIIEEVVQSPVGTTKVITTQQQHQTGASDMRNAGKYGRKKRNV